MASPSLRHPALSILLHISASCAFLSLAVSPADWQSHPQLFPLLLSPTSPEPWTTLLNILLLLQKWQCHLWSGKIVRCSTPKLTCQQELTSFLCACFCCWYSMKKAEKQAAVVFQTAAHIEHKFSSFCSSWGWGMQTTLRQTPRKLT